jgi:UPF0716 protein FxsA
MAVLVTILLIALPFAEIALFIAIGERLGVLSTVALAALAALAGVAVLRHQGLATLADVRKSLDEGRFPVAALFDGACVLAAGVLLLIPGFITDAFALLLFAPPVRRWLRRGIGNRLAAKGRVEAWSVEGANATVIEGEYERVEPANDGANRSRAARPLPPKDRQHDT